MKVKDLIQMDVDIDVYDNVCEELGIAFCGALHLTEKGKRKFVDVLEYDVTLTNNGGYIVAIVDVDGENWKTKLRNAKEFFESAAGYCTTEEYDEWFSPDPIYKVWVDGRLKTVTYDKEQAYNIAKAYNGKVEEVIE